MDAGMTDGMIKLTKLTASPGYLLTNGRAYGREVYLGKNDKAENWYEITKEQYEAALEAIAEEE